MNTSTREELFTAIHEAARATYGKRLAALAIFGSWARGAATPASDLDLLVVADPLPPSRMKRVREFRPGGRGHPGGKIALLVGSGPRDRTLARVQDPARTRCGQPSLPRYDAVACGTRRPRRVPFKGGVFWDYKPDFKPGDVVEL